MARSCPRLGLHRGRCVWNQLASPRVKAEDHDFVCAQITCTGEPVGWVEHNAMGMWSFLTLSVYARAQILLHVRSFAQAPVAIYRKDSDVATRIISYQNKSTGLVHDYVTRCTTQRWLLIQQPQLTCPLIDGKGAEDATFPTRKLFDFVNRV